MWVRKSSISVYQFGSCAKNVGIFLAYQIETERVLPKVDEISIVNKIKGMFPNIIFGITARWRNRVVIYLAPWEMSL